MRHHPIPKVSASDIERIVQRDFPASLAAEVHEILRGYGNQEGHREADRVRVAALKLAAGDIERLRNEIAEARKDYRDTLAAAEYPRYDRDVRRPGALPEAVVQHIIDSDWREYQEWLTR